MSTWNCAVDEMYVTPFPVNYPLKNTSITPPYIPMGKCIRDVICVPCVFSRQFYVKVCKNEKYHKLATCTVYYTHYTFMTTEFFDHISFATII